jgi:hypothetical protein
VIVERLQTARRAATRHAVAAERAGFSAHEQALTEIVLTRAAPAARVWTFSQREEAKTGADWLWWWRGGGQWFGALVQAKRNKPARREPWYDFGYRTGSGQRQVDVLLGTARRHRVPAVYVLYNHPPIPAGVSVSRPCCSSGYEGWRTRLRVAVLPALIAQALVGGMEDAALLIRSLQPAVTDPGLLQFLTGQPSTLPSLVARGVLAQLTSARFGQFREATPELERLDREVLGRLFTDLPLDQGHFAEPYFDHVLRGLRREPPWYVAAALEGVPMEEIGADVEGIEGLVVFEDIEPE